MNYCDYFKGIYQVQIMFSSISYVKTGFSEKLLNVTSAKAEVVFFSDHPNLVAAVRLVKVEEVWALFPPLLHLTSSTLFALLQGNKFKAVTHVKKYPWSLTRTRALLLDFQPGPQRYLMWHQFCFYLYHKVHNATQDPSDHQFLLFLILVSVYFMSRLVFLVFSVKLFLWHVLLIWAMKIYFL